MKVFKLFSIAAIAIAITSCASSGSDKNAAEGAHDSTACTEHNHEHDHGDACEGHNHEMVVVGVAQQGDYTSGKITISTVPGGEKKEFDYTKSNQDKIAAWQAGDTVSIFIDHHHHGENAHDSITAIKFGVKECAGTHNHEGNEHHDHENCDGHDHENCDGHDHNHKH